MADINQLLKTSFTLFELLSTECFFSETQALTSFVKLDNQRFPLIRSVYTIMQRPSESLHQS